MVKEAPPTGSHAWHQALIETLEVGSPEWHRAIKEKDFAGTKRSADFMPYVRVKYCPFCPSYRNEKSVFFNVSDLQKHPLLDCNSAICRGQFRQLTRRQYKQQMT